MLATHPLSMFAQNAAVIAKVAAAVGLGVGVDDLAVKSRYGHTESVVVVHHGGGVYDKCNHIARTRLSEERNDAVVGVVKIDPIKTCVTVVLIPQGRLTFVRVIEMLNEPA